MENRSQKKETESEQQADKEDHRTKNPFDRHTFEKLETTEALETLELLDIHTATQQCSKAFRMVRDPQWAELLKSGQFQKAKEFLLHVAVIQALYAKSSEKGDLIPKLLPQIRDRKMIECMLYEAISEHDDYNKDSVFSRKDDEYLEFGKAVCRLCDYSPDDYIVDALGKKKWNLVFNLMSIHCPPQTTINAVLQAAVDAKLWNMIQKLMRMYSLPRTIIDTVLQAAIDADNMDLMADCVKHNCDKRLLNIALIKSLRSRDTYWRREWRVLNSCHLQGEDLAAALTEAGFDLNAKTGENKTSLLQDAFDSYGAGCQLTTVQKLLDAGADPDAHFNNGETAVGQAVKRAHAEWNPGTTWVSFGIQPQVRWDLVILLLKHNPKAGETVLKQMYKGQTALHAVCRDGLADTLLTLVKMKANPLVRNSHGETLMMTAMDTYMYAYSSIDPYEGRENMIRALIQVGVSTHHAVVSRSLLSSDIATQREFAFRRSPMLQAVKQGDLRLAKLLYASGACSYKEIYELSNVLSTMDLSKATQSPLMLDFVNKISSHPRSLLNTCALTISHLIGCGPERETRAANTGLPEALRRRVMHDHVIHPDFLKDTPKPQRTAPARGRQWRGCCRRVPRSLNRFEMLQMRGWRCSCLTDD